MAQEKTAAEAKDQEAERPVRILRRCYKGQDLNPGDIAMIAGELWCGDVMRELTGEEREEFDEKVKQSGIDQGFSDGPVKLSGSVRGEVILQALGQLNPGDDNDWLESGKPAMSAVNRELLKLGATPDTSSRAEVQSLAPDFMRPTMEPTGAASDVGSDPVGMAPAKAD